MILREVAISVGEFPSSAQHTAFVDNSRVICSLITKSFAKTVHAPGFLKVVFRVNSSDRFDSNKIIGNVLFRHVDEDLGEYAGFSELEKGEFQLKLILRHLRAVFEEYSMPLSALSQAEEFVVKQSYRNTFVGKEKVLDATGQRVAYIVAEQFVSKAKIYLCVAAKKNNTIQTRVLIAEDRPDEFILQAYFGRVEWVGDDRLRLTYINGAAVEAVV